MLEPVQHPAAAQTTLFLFRVSSSSSDAQHFNQYPPYSISSFTLVADMKIAGGWIHVMMEILKHYSRPAQLEGAKRRLLLRELPATQCGSECAALQSTATAMSCSGKIINAVDTPAIPPVCEMIFGLQFFHAEFVPTLLLVRAGITAWHNTFSAIN